MDYYPPDLVALPTAPWAERPAELPLDTEECRTALWLCRGNTTDAADMLKVKASRLRTFVSNSEYLRRELEEATEVVKDLAEKNVYEALTDEKDAGRRDSMTRWFLERKGKDRGYGNSNGTKLPGKRGTFTVSWDVDPGSDDANTIDVTPQQVS